MTEQEQAAVAAELEQWLAENRRRLRRRFVWGVLVPILLIWATVAAFLMWYYW